MTSPVAHHVAVLVCCVAAWPLLVRARWTWRSPPVGVATWHLWCAGAVTAVALALGHRAAVRTRCRHLDALALVARTDPAAVTRRCSTTPRARRTASPGRRWSW